MMTKFAGLACTGQNSIDRATNILNGAAPFYRCCRCSDGREIAVGSIESHFYLELLVRLGLNVSLLVDQRCVRASRRSSAGGAGATILANAEGAAVRPVCERNRAVMDMIGKSSTLGSEAIATNAEGQLSKDGPITCA